MTTIFLSHSTKDKTKAQKLQQWLEADEQGHRVFIDNDGIKSGEEWEQVLYEQLRGCRVFLPLFTPNWMDSKWCFAEMTHARASGKLILPVKINPAFTTPLFSDLQQTPIDLSMSDMDGFQRLNRALREEFPWDNKGQSPYPGLLAFQVNEAAIYRGRDPEISSTLETLEGLRRQGASAPHFVLLLGASGSGKSSLLRAGLIPRLRLKNGWLVPAPFRPLLQPFSSMAETLAVSFQKAGSPRSVDELEEKLLQAAQEKPVNGDVLLNLIRDLRIAFGKPQDTTLLLSIDQGEELFAPDAQQTQLLLGLLRNAIEKGKGRLMVLVTMRSEFLGTFQDQPFLLDPQYGKSLSYEKITLDPLPTERFREIITEPAELAGLTVDDDLVERMVADTATRDALPLLAYTLRRMWDDEKIRADSRFELGEYIGLGGIEGSIRKAADEALNYRSAEELQTIRETFVPGMVRLSADGSPVRRRILKDKRNSPAEKVLKPFIDSRLLITDTDSTGKETVEVTHEALLRVWPELIRWLKEDRNILLQLEGLSRAAQDWKDKKESPDMLVHRGDRLSEVIELTRMLRFRLEVNSVECRYLNICEVAQVEQENKEKRRRKKKITVFKRWLAVAGVLLIIAGGTTIYAFVKKKEAIENMEIAKDKTIEVEKQKTIAEERYAQAEASALWSNFVFKGKEISSNERYTLWKLTAADRNVKIAFLEQLLASSELGKRFAIHHHEITRALVGFDNNFRNKIIKLYLSSHNGITKSDSGSLAVGLLSYELEATGSIEFLLEAIKETKDRDELRVLGRCLKVAFDTLPEREMIQEAKTLGMVIQGIENENENEKQLRTLVNVLETVVRKLPECDNNQLLETIIQIIQGSTNSSFLSTLDMKMEWAVERIPANLSYMFAETLILGIDKVTTKDQLQVLEDSLRAVTGVIPASQVNQLADTLVRAIQEITNPQHPQQLDALGGSLEAIARRIPRSQVIQLAETLVQAIREATDDNHIRVLGRSFEVIAGKISENQDNQLAETLVQGILKATNDIQITALTHGLEAVKDKISESQANQLAETLVQAILAATNDIQITALMHGLEAVKAKISEGQANQLAETLVPVVQSSTDNDADKAGRILEKIAGKISESQVPQFAETMLLAVQKTRSEDKLKVLMRSLEAVADEIPVSQANQLAEILVQAIKGTTDMDKFKKMRNLFVTVVGKIPDDQINELAKILIQATQGAKNIYLFCIVATYLDEVEGKLMDSQSNQLAETVVKAFDETKNEELRGVLVVYGLVSVTSKLPKRRASQLAETMVEAFQEAKSEELRAALALGLVSITGNIPASMVNQQIEALVRVLYASRGLLAEPDEELWWIVTDKIPANQVNQLTETMIQVCQRIKDDNLLQSLGIFLTLVADKISGNEADQLAETLLKAILEATNDIQIKALGSGLVTIKDRISESKANQMAVTLVQFIKDSTNTTSKNKVMMMGEILEAVAANLESKANQLSEIWIEAILGTTNGIQIAALSSGWEKIMDKISGSQANQLAVTLIQGIQDSAHTTSEEKIRTIGNILEAVAANHESKANQLSEILIDAILRNKNDDQLFQLGRALQVAAVNIPESEANQVSETLVEAIQKDTNDSQMKVLWRSLEAVAANIPENQIDHLAEFMVDILQKTTTNEELRVVIALSLKSVAGNIPESQVNQIVEIIIQCILEVGNRDRHVTHSDIVELGDVLELITGNAPVSQANRIVKSLAQVIKITTRESSVKELGRGLQVVAGKIPASRAIQLSEELIQIVQDATKYYQIEALGDGLKVVAGKIPESLANQLAESLIQVIQVTTDDNKIEALGDVLKVVVDLPSESQTNQLAGVLVQAIKEVEKSQQIEVLRYALEAVVSNMQEGQEDQLLTGIEPVVLKITNDDKLQGLYIALRAVVKKLSGNESNITVLFKLLKNPIIDEHFENDLIEDLYTLLSKESNKEQSFWSMIELFQKKFPGFDLSSQSKIYH